MSAATNTTVIQLAYLGASLLFILGLQAMNRTETARRGVRLAEVGMLLAVIGTLIGALMFANFINFTSLPGDLQDMVRQFSIHPIMVIVAICVIYVLLGCVLESMSMVLLTVPVFYPLVQGLGFDLIWFGIIVVVVTEISFITPPVGLNVMVLKSLLPDVPMRTLFGGVMPFVVADVVRLALLIAFPVITLTLPRFLG